MKKTLALILALVMVLALCACGGGSDGKASGGDDLAQWKAYLKEYALAGAPSEEAGQTVVAAIDEAATAEDVEAIPALGVMFSSVGVMYFNDWVAAGKPAADTSNMGSPDDIVFSDEPSGEPAN